MSVKFRSVVALLLLAGFPLVVFGIGGAVVAAGIWLASVQGRLGFEVGLFGVALLGSLLAAVTSAVRARPRPLDGPELTRAAEPVLWQVIDVLTGRMGVLGPRRIVLDPQVNAAVTEVAGHREMVIGLPLLAALTRDELLSVVAHELGHYAHGHTRLTALTYRWSLLVENVLVRIDSRMVRGLLTSYYQLYLLFASAARRQQELQADEWSARLISPTAAASALLRLRQVDACWSRLVTDYLPLTGPARRRPQLTVGLRALIAADAARSGPGEAGPGEAGAADPGGTRLSAVPGAGLDPAEPVSRFDSHPPIAERVARFRSMHLAPGPAPDDDPTPASVLIRHGDRGLAELERQLLQDEDPEADWQEIVELAGDAEARFVADLLARSAQRLGVPAPVRLIDLLDLVAAGRGRDLVAPTLPGGLSAGLGPPALELALTSALGHLVHLSLAGSGRTRHVLSWTGPRRWQLRDAAHGWADADLIALVGPVAHDPASVARLIGLLRSWDADLDQPVRAAEQPPDQALAAWGHLLLGGPLQPGAGRPRGGNRICDVLVCSTGVLLVRPGRVVAFSLNPARAFARRALQRCTALVDQVGSAPAGYPARRGTARDGGPVARWLPVEQLVGVEHDVRALRGDRHTLVLRSGERLVLDHADFTVTIGEPERELLQRLAPSPTPTPAP